MENLYIDIETYSPTNLKECGVYRYSEDPEAELLTFGYSIDGAPVKSIDVANMEEIPTEVLSALADLSVIKWAHNASFERVFLSIWLKRNYPDMFESYGTDEAVSAYLNPRSWKCSMVWSAYLGFPLSLEQVGAALKLPEQKLKEGKDLVTFFCTPCRPTKTNNGRTRNLPEHAPDKWKRFIDYNIRDVSVEMSIIEKMRKYPVPDRIWEEYWKSEEINDRGILVDAILAKNAIDIDNQVRTMLLERMKELTGIDNPNSTAQLKGWLTHKGVDTESLDKKTVTELLKDVPNDVAEVLLMRQMTARSSVKKYEKMIMTMCADGRARGMFMFYGASRTGRWAGRHVQLQNLPQNHLPDLAEARQLVRNDDIEMLKMLYSDIPDTLSQLIRTAFIPRPGCHFVVSDYSAVEARVLSFMANERWRIDVFREGKDIYCESASKMFHVPVEKHGQNSHLRQKGKVAELALGYGGSSGALISMGALEQGLEESELKPLVDAWRTSNPNIVEFWWDIDRAVKHTISSHEKTKVRSLTFEYKSGILFMILPSGRHLCYVKPRIEPNDFGGKSVTYLGLDANKKWSRLESYGPKFCENAIQAISRDLLAAAMLRLDTYKVCAHVHDELVIEAEADDTLEDICTAMGMTPDWIEGLLLRADGYECEFYQKD